MRKTVLKFAAMLVVAGAALPALAQQSHKFAFVMPLSGPFAVVGASQQQGAMLAVEEINAKGGIKGRKIEVTVEDSGPAPTTAVTALRRVMGGNPVAVFGPFLGTQVLAMSPETQKANVPFLVLPGTLKVTQLGNPWLFRFQVTDMVSRAVTVKYTVDKLQKKKIALLHVNDEYGIGGRDATINILKSEYNLAPVAVETYASTDRDVSAQISKVKSSGADVLHVQGNSGDIAAVIKQLRQQKFEHPIIASVGLTTPATMALLDQGETDGVYVESAGMPTVDPNPTVKEWVKAYEARWKRSPDVFAVQNYEAIKMVAQVIESKGADREAIRKGLREVRYPGLLGEVVADQEGNMYHTSRIYRFEGKTPKLMEAISVKPKL
ncbi:MAG: hypothetical protein JWP36_842 [Paucimonas sp.]|nr:hypothetical protein [Paucimonas sp.]